MTRMLEESTDVLYVNEQPVILFPQDIQILKTLAKQSARHRARICAHSSSSELVHEMFIALTNNAYIRPHKHIDKVESFSIIEGTAEIIFFNDDGSLRHTFSVGEPGSGKASYYRISEPIYHMQIVTSDYIVFHEVTQGPFLREKTVYAEWSPENFEHDYIESLTSKI